MVGSQALLEGMSAIKAGFLEDEDVDWQGMTRAARPFVPLSTLWYLRNGFDRFAMDSLNAALDDDYYESVKRRNKKQQKERGGTGWWGEGTTPIQEGFN